MSSGIIFLKMLVDEQWAQKPIYSGSMTSCTAGRLILIEVFVDRQCSVSYADAALSSDPRSVKSNVQYCSLSHHPNASNSIRKGYECCLEQVQQSGLVVGVGYADTDDAHDAGALVPDGRLVAGGICGFCRHPYQRCHRCQPCWRRWHTH